MNRGVVGVFLGAESRSGSEMNDGGVSGLVLLNGFLDRRVNAF